MTRSKKDPQVTARHDKHIARNGLTDIRSPLKKSGAGFANWGCLGEELVDVKDDFREQAVADVRRDTKLQLVDSEVFEHMHRRGEQQVTDNQTNGLQNGH
ncbi:hypothetical protein BDB00DRAFT_818515 [Zychaea mexicana]|uniref:uncharacterized protein n=1 Tax=Zychaea mexicana TaxID=64656 RepID=UPI0022FE9D63|nr:uncharacterized protein BDB00DRAFT_818515 [Zychaea mexicana]KAI9494553.1 hypothetical protein BDB00DRAFT_818515 [Zychaea mexicana]